MNILDKQSRTGEKRCSAHLKAGEGGGGGEGLTTAYHKREI